MGLSLSYKILKSHLVTGNLIPGEEIGIKIDQTLTQDATGTMAYLQFEALGIPKVKTKLSVSYVDHNTLQTDFMNADDHKYLQSVASKYGIYFSKPGNGICHQVHLERFAVPGETLLGSDSHTPTAGGMGMVAIGAGGLDVAVAMGGGPFYLNCPKVVKVILKGKLRKGVSAKDIILELLRRLTVKGGVGKCFEYTGEGVKTLTIPERATITNMGAELGATFSIFPSDEQTLKFLDAQGRAESFKPLAPDPDAEYSEEIEIDLSQLEPLIAQPHMPDRVVPVSEIKGKKIDQVCIGSCTNSSYTDLMKVAHILKGNRVAENVSATLSPGSKQVFEMIALNGALAEIIKAGVRILESACGPCIGMGQAPPTGGVTLRTFNRNFEGRSGTKDAQVFLCSPEVAAVSAIKGEIANPMDFPELLPEYVDMPEKFIIDDSLLIPPSKEPEKVEIIRGPNIKPLPKFEPLPNVIKGKILLKVEDNITTDHIMPAGAKILPLRSNIPAISEYVFSSVDSTFPKRAKEEGGGFVVGGANYGQGSSREHAALAPKYLGVKAVIVKSFARIHLANLINFGILPLSFVKEEDYELLKQNGEIEIFDIKESFKKGDILKAKILGEDKIIELKLNATERQKKILLAGGLLNYTKEGGI
ncbi:MAG: aconitate hydratase [Thermoanaerobaculia bacterium]